MLQALGATVTLVSSRGTRVLPIAKLFANDGMRYLTRQPDEVLTAITLPATRGWRSAYRKLRRRGSFDFPVASAAVAAQFDGAEVVDIRIVLGAVASRPLESERAAALLRGQRLTDERITEAAAAASDIAKPMDNTDFELVWRKLMVRFLLFIRSSVNGSTLKSANRRRPSSARGSRSRRGGTRWSPRQRALARRSRHF
jgi:CO/xanthine dehydrogenase FAD-binding subunit